MSRLDFAPSDRRDEPGAPVRAFIEALCAWLAGQSPTLGPLPPVDLSNQTPFRREVYAELQRVPAGSTTTYGSLAHRIGRPGASRAVGLAMARNPIPIIIPCHRVVGSDGSLTGFAGGIELKRSLLHLESGLPRAGVADLFDANAIPRP